MGRAYSITAVRTFVRPVRPSVRPVRNTNGFRAISFERIGVLDWNFIHRYVIIKYGQVWFRVKSANYFESYGPFFQLHFLQNACVWVRMALGGGICVILTQFYFFLCLALSLLATGCLLYFVQIFVLLYLVAEAESEGGLRGGVGGGGLSRIPLWLFRGKFGEIW